MLEEGGFFPAGNFRARQNGCAAPGRRFGEGRDFRAEPKDLRRRMRAMRKTVVEHDVARWAEAYLTALATLPEHHDKQVRPARKQ